MFKNILLTHPDKSTKYENSQIFQFECIYKKTLRLVLYIVVFFTYKTDFEIYDELNNIFKQMRTQIAEIITLYNENLRLFLIYLS